jgi:hypothetical protein
MNNNKRKENTKMRKTMKVSVSYRGNDPFDTRDYGTYDGIIKMEFDEHGNLYLTSKKEIKGISATFTDYIDIEVIENR